MQPENDPKNTPSPDETTKAAPDDKLSPHEAKALARRQRLSAALRANLRRRKDQLREKD